MTSDAVDSVSKADYIAALKTFTFENALDNFDTTGRLVTFQTNDGDSNSNLDPLYIRMIAANDPPVANSDSRIIPHSPVTTNIDVLANDTDV